MRFCGLMVLYILLIPSQAHINVSLVLFCICARCNHGRQRRFHCYTCVDLQCQCQLCFIHIEYTIYDITFPNLQDHGGRTCFIICQRKQVKNSIFSLVLIASVCVCTYVSHLPSASSRHLPSLLRGGEVHLLQVRE